MQRVLETLLPVAEGPAVFLALLDVPHVEVVLVKAGVVSVARL